ncbi:ATP-binding protein [Yinghuangia aomiensis]
MAGTVESNRVCVRLARDPGSVPCARAVIRAVMADLGIKGEAAENAELIVSELVTNAVRVAAPADRVVGLRVAHEAEGRRLRIEVSDGGAGLPEPRCPGGEELGGRGLLLVAALSDCWGVRPHEGATGKTVWAELETTAGS